MNKSKGNLKIENLFRNNIKNFIPYKPTIPVEEVSISSGIPVKQIIKLDAGENTLAPIDGIFNSFSKIKCYGYYPDPYATELNKEIAKYCNLNYENVVSGNGSDELIDLICRVFMETGDESIIPEPTFPMFKFYTDLNNGVSKQIKRNDDLSINENALKNVISKKTKILWIANPNNPAGPFVSIANIEKYLSIFPIVVVDEAYFEFCGKTSAPLLNKYKNLIIIRTFSKWAGLAGLRIGYLLAAPEIVSKINAIKSPYNTNIFAQRAGLYVLKNKQQFLKVIELLNIQRKQIINELRKIKEIEIPETDSHFFIVKLKKKKAKDVLLQLRKKGILAKLIDNEFLQNSIRLAPTKNDKETDKFLSVFKDVIN